MSARNDTECIAGIAIIVGSLMAILTMVLHPVGGDLRTDIQRLTKMSAMIRWVHILAIVGIAIQAWGFLGFVHRCGLSSNWIRAGLVAMTIGWISVICAALASGMVSTELIARYQDVAQSEQPGMHVLWDFNFWMNHLFTKLFIVTSMIGTFAWSMFLLGYRGYWKLVGCLGLLVAIVGIASLVGGLLRIDVLHFGGFVFGYSIWTIAIGFGLVKFPIVRSKSK